ncbi:hypothetical protein MY11210_008212 [Beauveria gryllotalpidicola]
MMRREFSSQHPASSSTPTPTSPSSSTSSTTTTTPTSATSTSSGSSTSPIHLRRQRRRAATSCRHVSSASTRHLSASAAAAAKSASTLLARNPALAHKLRQMALPLSPLVQLTTGAVHPDFPSNVLQFWLLTDAQLEALAAFYHQTVPAGARAPSPWAAQYPCPVRWRSDASLESKRRRMGRFIGLRGCETPVDMVAPAVGVPKVVKSEEEIALEARMARMAADEEALRRKTTPGPWGR